MSDTQIVELAGRHYLISQFLRDGVEVAIPVRDRGVDLIAYLERENDGTEFFACPIQLKAHTMTGVSLYQKYEHIANLLLVYAWHVRSSEPELYALTYKEAFTLFDEAGHIDTDSWRKLKCYVITSAEPWRNRLKPYRMEPGMWRNKLLAMSGHPIANPQLPSTPQPPSHTS